MTTIFLCLAILIAPAGFWPRRPNPRRHPYLKKHTHDPSYSNQDLLSVLAKLLFPCSILCYIDGKVSFNSFMRDMCALRMPVKSILLFKEGVLAKGLAPSYLTARFNKRSTVHDKDTRNKDSLIIPHYKSTFGQRLH